jgi:hypothetical protein
MVSFAGDLRREAKQAAAPEHAAKLQRAAANLESTALQKVGLNNPLIGKLLDILT